MRKALFILFVASNAWATFQTPTQIVFNSTCTAMASCAIPVAPIGAGHLLVVTAHIGNTQSLASVTATGETFTVIPSSSANGSNCPFNGGGNTTQMGCAYVLASIGGATSVTCNWSGTATSTNTACGFYEIPYTAQSIYLENNAINANNSSASTTFNGADFSNNFTTFINGTNDIIFQMANVSTGTIASINSSFILDNNTGRVGDAHLSNTFSNTPPVWTNSSSTSSLISAFSFGENFNNSVTTFTPNTSGIGLMLSTGGVGSVQTLSVTEPGQFKLVFESSDSWGIAQWYDLVNDASATTNLLGPAYATMSTDITLAEPGLFQRTYYDYGDTKQFCRPSYYYFGRSPRSLNIIESGPARVVVETKSVPTVTATEVANNLIGTARYYIYPNGQVYVHYTVTLTTAGVFNSNNIYSDVTLEDPTQTGTTPPDTQGWIRASATQNPYTSVSGAEPYLYSYWGPGTSSPYTNYTKASILLVRNPNNLHDGNQIVHSWGSATGFGVVRWGWSNSDTINVGAGGTETEDMLIQLGTQGSSVLPNLISSTTAGPIAAAYIANPTPPSVRGPGDPLPSSFKFFPSTNVWQTDITNALVSSSSTLWIDTINGHAGHNFHPNFGGAAFGDGSYNGIPYNIVYSSMTPRMIVPLSTYASQSDTPPVGGVPIPPDAIAENDIVGTTHTVGGDQHLLLVDISSGMTYELFAATRVVNSSSWTAAQLTVWYSASNVLRTDGWTSADAGGLPLTQGLLRYDEVSPTCNITHAIRMELSLTHGPHIWPARHDADSGGSLNPPFGMRVRMKANVDLSGLSTISQCIFNAAKKYGFILADNGGDWYIDGMPNAAWDDNTLHNDFISVGLPLNTMEVIDESTWIVDPNSAQAQSPFRATSITENMTGKIMVSGNVKFQ